MKGLEHSGLQDVSLVLDALTEALATRHPYSRYTPTEASWWLLLQAATHLPTALADRLFLSPRSSGESVLNPVQPQHSFCPSAASPLVTNISAQRCSPFSIHITLFH
ncbi:D-beta-hydroxybutyrate dehydrogenase, mitochondrial-like [Thamnophis elegans]|uniref:D-beta-hydroxybutyrate dehydrogenase, mitochondrial-like n=1 Tax=Thamnophis elegans TaxID=35005 RepID=UPI001378A938|nr:D-beta-hydroxybutyrate dehydrogenase, mitochondrial-like [Thamnophis elegans]